MTDKVLCPWCGAEMELLHDYSVGGRYATYWCNKCGAESPSIKQRIRETEEALDKRCFSAALRRYEPPCRPMNFETASRVIVSGETTPLYLEDTDGDGDWEISYKLRRLLYNAPNDYGKTWRCWPRKPTEDERQAAGWEDAE